MKIQIRANSVVIEGYVNAVERKSKPLFSRFGEFVEKICAGAFGRALERNNDVRIYLNHDGVNFDLGGTGTGELELNEDAIGLHARATITRPEVVEDAKHGNLVGWSFGFTDRDVTVMQDNESGLPLRSVKDLDLVEVSILNREKEPAYAGTLVNVRDGEKPINLGEDVTPDNIELIEETAQEVVEEIKTELREAPENVEAATEQPAVEPDTKSFDNSKYINIVNELKAMQSSVK